MARQPRTRKPKTKYMPEVVCARCITPTTSYAVVKMPTGPAFACLDIDQCRANATEKRRARQVRRR